MRLRASALFKALNGVVISIPSGAIKSQVVYLTAAGAIRFQFLLVRLRARRTVGTWYNLPSFQFLLVRLRDSEGGNETTTVSLFQFLLVRLRVAAMIIAQGLAKFQFLLVRLRGLSSTSKPQPSTRFQFLLVRLRVWPKRFKGENGKPKFQFLLVRLRVTYRKLDKHDALHISIPSGAIKRYRSANLPIE